MVDGSPTLHVPLSAPLRILNRRWVTDKYFVTYSHTVSLVLADAKILTYSNINTVRQEGKVHPPSSAGSARRGASINC